MIDNHSGRNDKVNLVKPFFSFDEMISPTIIKVMFILAVLAILITGVGSLFAPEYVRPNPLLVLFGMVMGIMGVRVIAEAAMVIFKIHGEVREVRTNTAAAK